MTRKIPNRATNSTSSEAEPVAKPRWRNRRGSSSGCSMRSSHKTNAAEQHDARRAARRSVSGSDQPWIGPSMMPSTSPPMASAESTVPSGSRPTCSLDRVFGTNARMATKVDGRQRRGHEEDRRPGEVAEHPAGAEHAERAAGAGEPGPDAHRPSPLLGREDAGDGGQGAGHDQRAADAGERAERDELGARVRERRQQRADAEDDDARRAARACVRSGHRWRRPAGGATPG